MEVPCVTRVRTSVPAVALSCLMLAGCGSTNPAAPTALDSPELEGLAAPAQPLSTASVGLRAADTIQINGGTVTVAFRQPGTAELRGSRGFRFDGVTHSTGVDPNAACQTDTPCTPGQSVTLTATWSGIDLPGTARMQGNDYADVGGLNSESALRIDITGSFVAPPQATSATVVVPVAISGLFQSADGFFEIEGDGRAVLTLEWVAVQGLTPTWVLRRTRFEFGGGNLRT